MRGALVAALVGLLVLAGTPWAASDPVVLSLVLLALAAATSIASRGLALTPAFGVAPPVRGHGGAPLRRGRPTDPTHHPLAPRAPGLA